MSGEFFFMALGGLGVSLAGFAGLIAAFGRSDEGVSAAQAWRITNVVLGGATMTLTGFGVVAAYLVVDDEQSAIRIAAGLLALLMTGRAVMALTDGPAWEGYERRRRLYRLGYVIMVTATVVDVFVGSLGFFAVLMMIHLLDVFGVFMNATGDFVRKSGTEP